MLVSETQFLALSTSVSDEEHAIHAAEQRWPYLEGSERRHEASPTVSKAFALSVHPASNAPFLTVTYFITSNATSSEGRFLSI